MHSLRRTRRGAGTLVAALVLLAVLSVGAIVQYTLSRQAAGQVHRIQLSALARLQARSAIQELVARVARDANTRGTKVFRMLRAKMDERWEELDLTELVEAPHQALEPGWGRLDMDGVTGRASSRILRHRVRIRGTRSAPDVQGSEEWVGVLTLGVVAEVSDELASVTREVEENHEIRTLLIGPPRPFDQIALYLGKTDAAVDPRKVNAARRQLVAEAKEIYQQLQAASPEGLSAEQAEKLKKIQAGMLPPEEIEERTPVMPEEPSALWGFYHTGRYYLQGLGLLPELDKIRAKVARLKGEVQGARGEAMVEAFYHLVDEHSDAVNLIWDYQRVATIAPHEGKRFQESIARFLPRLTPEHYLARTHLRIHPDDPVFQRWLAGETRLEGVLDLTEYGRPLVLKGHLKGRVMLVVGEHGVQLDQLNDGAGIGEDRVVVVSLGGDVEVQGRSTASILMLGTPEDPEAAPGTIRIPYSAYLTGNLIIPHPTASSLVLEGSLHYDGRWMAAYPVKRTLFKPGPGDYLVAVSPTPLFVEGRAP